MIVHLTTTCIVFVLLVLPVVAIYKQTPIGDRNFDLDTMGYSWCSRCSSQRLCPS